MRSIKKIILLCTLGLISHYSQCQELTKRSWYSNTSIGLSTYHFGSYSKQRPIFYLEQSFEIALLRKIRLGLGTGLNLYPATLTIPVFANTRFIAASKNKWTCYITQSYGRNLKIGRIGFNSNRYTGNLGNSFKVGEKLWLQGELGYLINWDKYGGGSVSLNLNFGMSYKIK